MNNNASKGALIRLAKRISASTRQSLFPSNLGALFVLALVHELAGAKEQDLSGAAPSQALEQALGDSQTLQTAVEIIRDTYPDISDRLFSSSPQETDQAGFDGDAVRLAINEMQASGYLSAEEAARLLSALRELDAAREPLSESNANQAGSGGYQDVIAQATTTAKEAAPPSASNAASGVEQVISNIASGLAELSPVSLGVLGVGALALISGSSKADDTTAPVAPTLALATDSGASSTDGLTKVGTVNVGGIESGATWQYSTDGGVTWSAAQTASTSSFTLSAGSYASGKVQVRQTDAAGNVSAVASSTAAIVVDVSAAAPTLALATDSGASSTDGLTKVGTVNVGGIESGATWQYSTDGGVTWSAAQTASTSSFTLSAGSYASGKVQVRQTDVAGNVSESASAGAVTVDASAPGATIALSDTALKAGETATVTITFSEAVAGFASADDVTVQNGTLSAMTSADGGVIWTGSFTPTTDLEDASNSISLASTYSDVAGNTGTTATSANYAIDTKAPTLQLLEAHSADRTVVLSFSEDMDGTNLPATTEFSVTTGGVANPVASISATGTAVTLTLTNAFAAGAVNVTYTPTAGDQANAVQDLAGNDYDSGFSSGILADGYIRDAKVYIDTNANGVADADTDYYVGTTDDNGNFFLPSGAPSGTIIAIGGVNIDTGVPNTSALKAPAGSTTINPLTTLVQAVVDASGGQTDAAAAASSVASALGLSLPAGTSLTSYDPLAAADVSVQKAAAQIATVIALADTGGAAGAGESVIANLAEQVDSYSGTAIDLSDSGTLSAVLADAGLDGAEISEAVDASAAISSATSVSAISAVQSQFLDRIAPAAPSAPDLAAASDSGASSTDNITNQTSLTVRVALNNSATDGSAVVVGDIVKITDAGVQVASAVLTATNVQNGYVDISVAGLSAGTHSLAAGASDQAGNSSTTSSALSVTVDTAAPAQPTIAVIAGNDVINAAEQSSSITGAAEANATVTIGLGGTTHTVTASASGVWTYALTAADITAMGQGAEIISVSAKDAAGNSSAAATRSITIDTAAPTASVAITGAADNVEPTTGNVESGGSSNDNTLGLSGTVSALAAGEVLMVYDGTTAIGKATVSGSTWSFATPSLSNSTHSFTVRAVDAAGNTGAASAAYTVTVDAIVPTATASITSPADGDIGNDVTPTLTGTNTSLIAGEQIIVFDSGERLGEATVTGTSWTFTADALAEGEHSFSVVVQGSGGNQGAASSAVSVTIDATAPDVPLINAVATDNVIGGSEQTATISGSAEAGATVVLTVGSGNAKTVTAGADGTWSYTLSAADITAMGQGAETLSAIATDAAGNASAAGTLDVSVDTVAPGAPVFNAVATDGAINLAEKTAGVSITGTAEANAQIALTIGTSVRSITADSSGVWTYKLVAADYTAMGQGAETLTVTATDSVGNTSTPATASISVDTVAPTLTAQLDAASDTGVANDGKSSDTTPTLKGVADAGSTITIRSGETTLGSVVADSAGAWTLTSAGLTSDGAYQFTVTASDAAGNLTSRTVNYQLDSSAPAVPTIASVATDDVVNAAEQSSVIIGTAEAFAKVDLSIGGNVRSVNADSTGKWTYTLTAADITAMGQGAESLSAKATDAAGNVSAATLKNISIDTVAPTAAVAVTSVTDNVSSDTGNVANGGTTNDNTLVLSGTVSGLGDGELVVIYDGSTKLGVASVSGNVWSFATASLSNSAHSFTAQAWDTAGNAGSASGPYVVTVDATVPSATATITAITDDVAATTGTIASGGLTNDASPTLSGTNSALASGEVIAIFDNGVRLGEATVSGTGWTFTPSPSLTDGAHSFYVVVESANGNQGQQSAAVPVVVDTTAPATPSLSISDTGTSSSDGITNATTVTVSGVETGATWQYSVDSGSTWSAAQAASVTTFTAAAGTYAAGSVQVRQTDVAGNTSAAGSNAAAITIDTTAPTLAITSSASSMADGDVATLTFTFSEAPVGFDATDLTITGGTLGALSQATTNSDGTVVYTALFTADASDSISITAAQGAFTDAAGNNGQAAATPSIGLSYSVTSSDAYVTGASLFLDLDGDGVYAEGKDILATEGETAGTYSFVIPTGTDLTNAQIVSSGGIDTVSDGAVDSMSAAFGNTVVSYFSTLYNSADSDAAKAALLEQYGFTAVGDAADYDPYALMLDGDAAAATVLVQNQALLAISKNISALVPSFLDALLPGHVITAADIQEQIAKEITKLGADAANLISTDASTAASAIEMVFGSVLTAFGVENAIQYAPAYEAAAQSISSVSTTLMQFSDSSKLSNLQSGDNAAYQQTASDAMATDLATFIADYFAATSPEAQATLISNLAATYSTATLPEIGSGMNLKQALHEVVQFRSDYANSNPGASELEINTAIASTRPISGAPDATGLLFGMEITNPKQAISRLDVEDIASAKGLIIGDDITMLLSPNDMTDPGARGIALKYSLSKYMDSGVDYIKYDADFSGTTETGFNKVNITSVGDAPTGGEQVEVDILGGLGSLAGDVALPDGVVAPGTVSPLSKKIPVFDNNLNVVLMLGEDDDRADGLDDDVINFRTSLYNLDQAHIDSVDGQYRGAGDETYQVNIKLGSDNLTSSLHANQFSPDLDVTLIVSDAAAAGIDDAAAGALKSAGIGTIGADDRSLTVNSAQVSAMNSAGLSFRETDVVTLNDLSGQQMLGLAGQLVTNPTTPRELSGVDVVDLTDSSITLTVDQASALVAAGLSFADNDVGVQVNVDSTGVVVTGQGTELKTNLTDLQKLGVDTVVFTGGAGDGRVSIGIGAGDPIQDGGLPVISSDGIVVLTGVLGSELQQNTVEQLGAGAALVANAGFDEVDLSDNSVSLTDDQASALVASGLSFADNDSVQVNVDSTGVVVTGQGTELKTSLTDLQKLGVDAINVNLTAGLMSMSIGAGELDLDALPQIDAATGVQVGLLVDDADLAGFTDLGPPAQALSAAGFDVLNLADDSFDLSEAQASALVAAGLSFADNDTGVVLTAEGTQLQTSLSDMQKLGVDFVADGDPDAPSHLTVSLGDGLAAGVGLPVFDDIDDVTLRIDDDQVAGVLEWIDQDTSNVENNIDQLAFVLRDVLGIKLGGDGVLDARFSDDIKQIVVSDETLSNVTLADILDSADGAVNSLNLGGAPLVSALNAAVSGGILIEGNTKFTVSDADVKALMDAGLLSATGSADVTVTDVDGNLAVTLAQLSAIGADGVTGSSTTVDLDLGLSQTLANKSALETAIAGLLERFDDGTGVKQIFEASDTVKLHVDGVASSGNYLNDALSAQLKLLGIDDVVDDANTSLFKPPGG